MWITHVITRLIVGGAQENTVATVLGLQGRPGLQVNLVSGPTTGPEGSLESAFLEKPQLLHVMPSLVRPIHPLKDMKALNELTDMFRSTHPDVVHTHSGKAGVLGRLAAHRAGIPIIIHTIHGPSFGSFQGVAANFVFRNAERMAAKHTTHFVTVANAMASQYMAAGIGTPDQYTRVFSGFVLEPFLAAKNDLELRARWNIAPSDFVIGKIARLFKLKGHDDLLAAAPSIVQRCPHAKFLLVGDGVWKQRLQEKAAAMGLQQHFIFTGLVPPSEVPRYLGIMDVLVHLSRREGLARALPQALAAGRPVVAYNCDGANEVCFDNETGFLVPVGDLKTLSDRVIQLSEDPELRERLGERGRHFVHQEFSADTMVSNLHNLYKKLVLPH